MNKKVPPIRNKKTNNKKLYILFLLVGLLVGFLSGFFYYKATFVKTKKSENIENTFSMMREGGFKFISPLLDCENFFASDNKSHAELKKALTNYIDTKIKEKNVEHISVYYRNLNNGPWLGINEHHNYTPASLLKVPILVAGLKRAQADSQFLSSVHKHNIKYDSIFNQNVGHEKRIVVGSSYTVEQLLEYMILYSDNEAKEALIDIIGNDFIIDVIHDMGINLSIKNIAEDFISVKEYASIFRILFNASYLNKEMSEKALEMLSRTNFTKGIPGKLPKDILVSHKFGERGFQDSSKKQLHDCGIVYINNNPYLICIMTKGDDFDTLINVIADISEIVYKKIAPTK